MFTESSSLSSLQTLETITLDDVLRALPQPPTQEEERRIRCAYAIANCSHNGKVRDSGDPFIVHPLNVAFILAQLGMDVDTICAGLLHDTIEDSHLWIEYLAAACGEDVCRLVDGLTKIRSLNVASSQESDMQNVRHMLLFTAEDIRVIVVKLADRLHNMRTLRHLPPDKQKRIAEVTLNVYAPLAHWIGMGRIKWELEDLSLAYLHPRIYEDIKTWLATKRSEREARVEAVRTALEQQIAQRQIPAQVMSRAKHFYSIYQKMRRTGRELSQLHDLSAVRIITDTVENCYVALGVVHNLYRPVEGRMKDYIASPKPNGYQSLHTTVRTDQGEMVEVQIRTRDMHVVAEEGVAAHWRYKMQGTRTLHADEHRRLTTQIRRLLQETEETQDPEEFFDTLRSDLLVEEIYVYTPKGAVIRLPRGATAVDFAYQIHSDIGDHFCGARVDGKFVGQSYRLKTGETVEILTSPRAHPSSDWLATLKTARARAKVKRYLQNAQRDKLLAMGRQTLTRELARAGLVPQGVFQSEEMQEVCQRYSCRTLDDLFVAIGFGRLSTKQIVSRFVRPKRQQTRRPRHADATLVQPDKMDDILYRRARCCNPVPGEPITGVVTRTRGISIHRSDCPNIVGFRGDPDRLVALEWDTGGRESFDVVIDIGAKDRKSLLYDVSSIFDAAAINITSCKTLSKGGFASLVFTLEVRDIDQLERTMAMLERIDGVQSVVRRRRRPAAKTGRKK